MCTLYCFSSFYLLSSWFSGETVVQIHQYTQQDYIHAERICHATAGTLPPHIASAQNTSPHTT